MCLPWIWHRCDLFVQMKVFISTSVLNSSKGICQDQPWKCMGPHSSGMRYRVPRILPKTSSTKRAVDSVPQPQSGSDMCLALDYEQVVVVMVYPNFYAPCCTEMGTHVLQGVSSPSCSDRPCRCCCSSRAGGTRSGVSTLLWPL